MKLIAGHLQESAEELYENAPCGYLSTSPDGLITRVNRTFIDWTGYSQESLVGRRRFQSLFTKPGQVFHETHHAPLLRMQGFVSELAYDIACQNGEVLPVLVSAVQKRDDAGVPLVNRITVFDATVRRKYERELLRARRQSEAMAEELRRLNETLEERVEREVAERVKAEQALQRMQKLEVLGQLTGGVAHDFNNYLMIILGGLNRIRKEIGAAGPAADLTRLNRAHDMAMHGVNRAAALTSRLLAFARQQPLEPSEVDVNVLIGSAEELLRRAVGDSVRVVLDLAEEICTAEIDAGQLENALLNLAINARDAMPSGGSLTIRTRKAELDETRAAGDEEPLPAGRYVLVSAEDTGTGMTDETLKKVFEPFFTTKAPGKGTGLGLSQVYGFVRQSGGHVRIRSSLGIGTQVMLYLPCHEGVVERPAARAV